MQPHSSASIPKNAEFGIQAPLKLAVDAQSAALDVIGRSPFDVGFGLGFAGVLAGTPLVEGQKLVALLLFNLGVELGQVQAIHAFGQRGQGAQFIGRPEKAATGQRQTDASAVTDYFAALNTWLTVQNRGEKCGW